MRKSVAIVAISGTGKGTVIKPLKVLVPELQAPVSVTTRARRNDEVDGLHYYFYPWLKFIWLIISGKFIEWNFYNWNLYGTLYSEVIEKSRNGPLVFDVDINGALRLKKFMKERLVIVYLECPPQECERRLRNRDREQSERYIQGRIRIGIKEEYPRRHECDYILDYGVGAKSEFTANQIVNLTLTA